MLKIDNINVSYGHAKVLHDVSLEIRQGEMGFIIGRNGAGKTTLLKSIIGLLTPWSGSILFQGQAVVGLSPERLSLAGIRYVGQEKKVFASLTVRENLEIAAYACQEPVEKAIDRITGFYPKMKKFLDTKAGLLSGGQRQILLVGRALVGNPETVADRRTHSGAGSHRDRGHQRHHVRPETAGVGVDRRAEPGHGQSAGRQGFRA